jgi:hypothetical protein
VRQQTIFPPGAPARAHAACIGFCPEVHETKQKQVVLAIINGERAAQTDLMQLPDALRAQYAKHQAAHWIALGCVSFVREAEMRGETKSKLQVRSFMYTMAHKFTRCASENGALGSIARALQNSSLWHSNDKATRDAERDAFSRMATSRLAPGGQSLLPWVSEEDIRKTLTLAAKSRKSD